MVVVLYLFSNQKEKKKNLRNASKEVGTKEDVRTSNGSSTL